MESLLSQVLAFRPARLAPPFEQQGHIPFVVWLVRQLKPGQFVQLGTQSGNLYFAVCQTVAEHQLSTRCCAVGTWQAEDLALKQLKTASRAADGSTTESAATGTTGSAATGTTDSATHGAMDSAATGTTASVAESGSMAGRATGGKATQPPAIPGATEYNRQHYVRFSALLRMGSAQALPRFEPGSIDLLLIDGRYSPDTVRNEFESWRDRLSDRAVVLLLGTAEAGTGAAELWPQLQASHPHVRFDYDQGMGVVALGSQVPDDILQALARVGTPEGQNQLQNMADIQTVIPRTACLQLQVNGLQAELEESRGQLARLQEERRQEQAEHAQLQQQFAGLQKIEADRLQQRLDEARVALEEARAARAAAESHAVELHHLATAMQQSLCWRLTAPIRWVGTPINRTRQKAALLRRSIALRGGVAKTASQAVTILKNEGMQGLQARIGNAERLLNVPAAAAQAALLQPGEDPYHGWLRLYDPTDADTMAALKAKIDAMDLTTTFSVVMPVYNPPLNYLKQAIESVQAQVYPHWEICIADDASPNPEVRTLLTELAEKDSRIKLIFREKNGHISAATNSAMEIATGDYIALMDNDDLLPPHALAYMALAVHEHPNAGLIYSDEDKVTEDNVRQAPYFKCQFNYELFLSQNMISHFGVYRRSVLEEIGGFRVGYEGAQDWDLALRVIEKVGVENIVHVPRVLYHWRIFPGSTALALEEKDYALQAQLKSISSHLERMGKPDSEVFPAPRVPGLLRIRHRLPSPAPLVSIIIPTRDRVELVSMCIDSILEKTSYQPYQIVVVDNGSTEERAVAYLKGLEAHDNVRIVRADMPFNYSALNNLGVAQADGEYLVLMNNDIEITQNDWIEEMLGFASQPDIGCVGTQLWYPNNTLQHGGVVLGIGGVASHAHKGIPRGNFGYFGRASAHQMFSAVTAACLMVRKRVYEAVGGFDETLKVAYNDVDFCLKVRAKGLRNLYNPFASFVHHESASRGSDLDGENQQRLLAEAAIMKGRWGALIADDPAYSPNLTLAGDDFSMAWPSRVSGVISQTT
ncbi:glycosyltransferase [Lautropia dentalis]|nr:glycosyltransferase [Lautropia dentalis]